METDSLVNDKLKKPLPLKKNRAIDTLRVSVIEKRRQRVSERKKDEERKRQRMKKRERKKERRRAKEMENE